MALTLHDTQHTTGTLTRMLFGHIAPFGKALPLVLSELSLMNVPLVAHSFTNVIDFLQLTEITLYWCSGSMDLLSALAPLFHAGGGALQHLDFAGSFKDDGTVETFLKSSPCLQSLQLQCKIRESRPINFDYACLRKHLPTLAILGLSFESWNGNRRWESQPSRTVLDMISVHCPFLEDLALAMPSVTLSRGPDPAYHSAIVALCKCPLLRFLRIMNWPSAPNGCFKLNDTTDEQDASKIRSARYLGVLDPFATSIMRTAHNTRKEAKLGRLMSLVFGLTSGPQLAVEEDGQSQTNTDLTCYVGGQQINGYGLPEVVAIRKTEAEYEEIGMGTNVIHSF